MNMYMVRNGNFMVRNDQSYGMVRNVHNSTEKKTLFPGPNAPPPLM